MTFCIYHTFFNRVLLVLMRQQCHIYKPICCLQNARCLVKVKFSPKDSCIYEAKVPLFLGGNTTQPYYLVDVRGEGQYPRLKFDTKECIMPPVPLGFTSRACFYVISQGYDNLQLKACCLPHASYCQHQSGFAQVHEAVYSPVDAVFFFVQHCKPAV